MSIVLLNLLVCVWARGAHVEAPGAVPHGYADDTGAIAVGPDGCAKLQRLLDFTGAFASVTGQQLNNGKSKCWSTGASLKLELAQLRLAGVPLEVVTGMRCLGAHLSFERHALRNEVGEWHAVKQKRLLSAFDGRHLLWRSVRSWSAVSQI